MQAAADATLVQKLATHVAAGPGSSLYAPFAPSASPYGATLASAALAIYDVSSGSAQPDVSLTVVAGGAGGAGGAGSGGVPLLRARFTPGGPSVARNNTPLGSSGSGGGNEGAGGALGAVGNVSFSASGSGEVSLVASMRFVPAQLLPFPVSRGLSLQRAVQRSYSADANDTTADGGSALAGDGTATSTAAGFAGAAGTSSVRLMLPGFAPGSTAATPVTGDGGGAGAAGLGLGPPLRRVPLGSVVTLTLQLTAADDVGGPVRLEALLPAGLEPIDPNLEAGGAAGSAIGSMLLCPAQVKLRRHLSPVVTFISAACNGLFRCRNHQDSTIVDINNQANMVERMHQHSFLCPVVAGAGTGRSTARRVVLAVAAVPRAADAPAARHLRVAAPAGRHARCGAASRCGHARNVCAAACKGVRREGAGTDGLERGGIV